MAQAGAYELYYKGLSILPIVLIGLGLLSLALTWRRNET